MDLTSLGGLRIFMKKTRPIFIQPRRLHAINMVLNSTLPSRNGMMNLLIPRRRGKSQGMGGFFFDELNSGPHLPSSESEFQRPKPQQKYLCSLRTLATPSSRLQIESQFYRFSVLFHLHLTNGAGARSQRHGSEALKSRTGFILHTSRFVYK